MARQYSGKHGKHGSKKPIKKVKPVWLTYSPKEVEQLVVKLSKSGKAPSQIGLILRDSYGIPDTQTITGKKITNILEENKIIPEFPEDLISLMKREILLLKHLEKNKHDMTAKRGLHITESKINKLSKYYKSTGVLPGTWKYDRERIRLIVS
ncbi:30S ribosomal protein S15 [Candidatus Woesearchaeota archaeon]|nr:30S ribosomal protein S15 [Candidatus Woesearchaeota archaeon]